MQSNMALYLHGLSGYHGVIWGHWECFLVCLEAPLQSNTHFKEFYYLFLVENLWLCSHKICSDCCGIEIGLKISNNRLFLIDLGAILIVFVGLLNLFSHRNQLNSGLFCILRSFWIIYAIRGKNLFPLIGIICRIDQGFILTYALEFYYFFFICIFELLKN